MTLRPFDIDAEQTITCQWKPDDGWMRRTERCHSVRYLPRETPSRRRIP